MRYLLSLFLVFAVLHKTQAQDTLPIRFSENFADNSNRWDDWQELQEHVHNNTIYIKEEDDFRIEATFDIGSLLETKKSWGLSWGRSNRYNYFYFECGANKFRIGYYKNGEYKRIVGWKRTRQFKKAINKLTIRRSKNKLLFYVNGEKVHQSEFLPFFGLELSFRSPQASPIWKKLDIFQKMGKINVSLEAKNHNAQKKNLGARINSSYIDKFPIISPDGRILYFLREDFPKDYGSQDIWYAERLPNGEWTEAQNIGTDLNNGYANFVNAVFPDNNTLCINNTYSRIQNNKILAFTQKDGQGGWTTPVAATIENLQKQGRWVSFFLAADGRTLIFTMLRPDSYGGRDLYVSFLKDNGVFSEPMNLGPVLNTPANEHCPFLAPDGKTLYFDSDGHPGYGGRDIFVSRRLDDGWTNWSTPENMGPSINTKNSDEGLIIPASGECAYFVSNENSIGALDIYQLKLPESLKPNPTAILRGIISQCDNNDGVGTLIRVYHENQEIAYAHSNPKLGAYQLALATGKKYMVVVEIDETRYLKKDTILVDLVDISTYIEKDLPPVCLELLKKQPSRATPTTSIIRSKPIPPVVMVHFDYNKDQIRHGEELYLDKLVQQMKEFKTWRLEVTGHTDAQGSLFYNQDLSERRVNNVVKYLVEKGIEAHHIQIKTAKGETQPIKDNNSAAGRASNRRVELKVIP